MDRTINFVGRACLAALFLPAGIAKFVSPQPFLIHMAAHGVPAALLPVVASFETIMALALLTGFLLRPAAGLAALFCLTTAAVFHLDFADHVERTMFFKDIAIAGGLFAVCAYRAAAPDIEDGMNYARAD